MSHAGEREGVVAAAARLESLGLTHGTSGNVSVRAGDGFLITPTGVPTESLRPATVVWCDADGAPAPGSPAPSTEWRMHRDIYAGRPEVCAVVHTHSPYATAIACLRRPLPAVHYLVAAAGGSDVPCAEYATFGTPELSANALRALDGRQACLLANHGVVAVGSDLDRAVRLAFEVERLAEVYGLALAAGTPEILEESEMERVLERFRQYGQHGGI
ncbi:MAG: class II aldolase/adducin family protein [Gemmatimonadales bacterium]